MTSFKFYSRYQVFYQGRKDLKFKQFLLPKISCYFSGRQCDFTYKSENADWGALFRNYSLFGPVQCPKFMVLYDQRDSAIVKDFLKMLGSTCIGMNFTVGKPLEVPLQNNRANTYGDELTKQLQNNKVSQNFNMIFPKLYIFRFSCLGAVKLFVICVKIWILKF